MKTLIYDKETGVVKIINPSSYYRRSVTRVEGKSVYQDALYTLSKEDEETLAHPGGNQLKMLDGKLVWTEREAKPRSVSRRQLREALSDEQEAQIIAAINSLPDPTIRRRFRVWWEDHTEFSEDHPMVLAMVQVLGWEDSVTEIFKRAGGY